MSQQSLQALLGKIASEAGEEFEKAKAGGPQGSWNIDLPLDQELRLKVTKAELKQSNTSGKDQIAITYEVLEPVEWAGAMLQDYMNPNPPTPQQTQMLAKSFGALRADLTGFNDLSSFVAQFEDRTVVAAIRKWGNDPNDQRNGIRYLNADDGQELRSIKPPKPKGTGSGTVQLPDIQIPKDDAPAQVQTQNEAPAPNPASTTGLPGGGGPNLPPGLRTNT